RLATRRTVLRKGALLTGALGAFGFVDSAGAARRGSGAFTSICRPDGAGGYYPDSVSTVLLQSALNSGAIVSDCCSDAACGETNGCMSAYCDFDAGACAVSYANGASCERPGCADGYCSDGVCLDPTPYVCTGDGVCNICTYDACAHHCDCWIRPCSVDDYQCARAYCSPGDGGCVQEPMNEGGYCDTFGVAGTCILGLCVSE
ncbi:MAG: hypothetical protein KC438_04540, partial [Thermomicrobiales bacterium]|nr:hypothetical protein [Thermomicrobiales bacterium]